MTNFFQKLGVSTLTIRELFEFITEANEITKSNEIERRDALLKRAADRGSSYTEEEQVADEVFKRSFIPQKLNDVVDYERDVSKLKKGEEEDLLYKTMAPVKAGSNLVSMPEVSHGADGNC